MIKYKTYKNSIEIDAVEVKERDDFILIKGQRGEEYLELKISADAIYHDSWESAYAYLLSIHEKKVRSAELALNYERAQLALVQKMALS